jgi:Trk K+ transport system NAD-binding subunit
VPHGNTRLRQGDLLMLVGHQDALAKSLNQLDSNTL